MQEQKKPDRIIEGSIAALREERAPAHDAGRVVSSLHLKPRPWKLATAAVVLVAVGGAAVLLAPRDSAAAGLKRISRAIEQLPPRQEVHFVETGDDGVYEVALKLVVDEHGAQLEQKDAAMQTWTNDRLTIAYNDFATVQDASEPDWASKTFILRTWLEKAVPASVKWQRVKAEDIKLDLVSEIQIDPTVVFNRVAFDVRLEPDRLGHIVFDVEPVTMRPVLVQAAITGQSDIKIQLDYDRLGLRFDPLIPRPVKVYDLDQQRNEVLDGFASPIASVEVMGQRVLLHAAIVDHDGNLTFLYSDTDAFTQPFDKATVLPKGIQAEGPTLELMPAGADASVLQPVPYKDRKVALVSLRLNEEGAKLDTLKSVRLPVQRLGVMSVAEFTDVPLIRTGSTLSLLAPENVPFWTKRTVESAPTKGG